MHLYVNTCKFTHLHTTNVCGAQIVEYVVAIADDDAARDDFLRGLLPTTKVSMHVFVTHANTVISRPGTSALAHTLKRQQG
jgi:hypothetical protein